MTDTLHTPDVVLSGSASAPAAQPELDLRAVTPDDHRFVAQCWKESYKFAPQMDRLSWPVYRRVAGQQIEHLVATARTVGAYWPDGRLIGFLVYTPGTRISTVHWTYTRFKLDDEKCRRRGVMTLLLDAAGLGSRFVYTHRGPCRHVAARRNARGDSLDVPLATWLRGRGVSATYVPYEEWIR